MGGSKTFGSFSSSLVDRGAPPLPHHLHNNKNIINSSNIHRIMQEGGSQPPSSSSSLHIVGGGNVIIPTTTTTMEGDNSALKTISSMLCRPQARHATAWTQLPKQQALP